MIEVIHFKNRFDKQMVGVISTDPLLMSETPIGELYAKRYAAGLEKPFYPVPAIPVKVFIGSVLVCVYDPYHHYNSMEFYRGE